MINYRGAYKKPARGVNLNNRQQTAIDIQIIIPGDFVFLLLSPAAFLFGVYLIDSDGCQITARCGFRSIFVFESLEVVKSGPHVKVDPRGLTGSRGYVILHSRKHAIIDIHYIHGSLFARAGI